MTTLTTARLDLVPGTVGTLRADLESRDALAAALGVTVPAGWPPDLYDADAIRWVLQWMDAHPDDHAWGFRYVVLRETRGSRVLVGASGYKGAPINGAVEVGYGVVTEFRRRGFATEATSGLVANAFTDPRVTSVIAHTLPALVASIGVLERVGFAFAGAGNDPSEPTAIRYVVTRASFTPARRSE